MVTGVMLTRRRALSFPRRTQSLACGRHYRRAGNHEREGDRHQPGTHQGQYM